MGRGVPRSRSRYSVSGDIDASTMASLSVGPEGKWGLRDGVCYEDGPMSWMPTMLQMKLTLNQ